MIIKYVYKDIDKPLYYQAKVHPVIIYISTSYEYF
jgi:hypothetical protein